MKSSMNLPFGQSVVARFAAIVLFVLAGVIGSKSALAIGAVGVYEFSDNGTNRVRFYSVTGFSTEEEARTALATQIVNPITNMRPLSSAYSVLIIPNGMWGIALRCFYGSGGNLRHALYTTVSFSRSRGTAELVNSCITEQGANNVSNSDLYFNGQEGVFDHYEPFPRTCPAGQQLQQDNSCIATLASCNANNQIFANGRCAFCTGDTPLRNGNACQALPSNSDNESDNTFLYAGLGVVALGGLYLFASSDFVNTYNFSPTYHYEITDNGYSYSAGARLDYQADNWNLYYKINTNLSDSHLRYATGAEYSGDFWSVAFSEEIDGDNVDYDFSLSAKVSNGNWEFAPTYRLHSRFEDFSTKWENDINNFLNLEGVWYYNQWTIKPSAGFQWQNFDKLGEKAQFNLLAVWQF